MKGVYIMVEIWKPIKDFEGYYEVSNFGRIKALERLVENNGGMQKRHEKILKPDKAKRKNGEYYIVSLCKNKKIYKKLVHRIVAETFIPNPENKPVVDHIDTDPSNNFVTNLRWATAKENALNPLSRINNSKSKIGHPYHSYERTEEIRKKLSLAKKGKPLSEEHKKKLSESHKNSIISKAKSAENLKKAHKANLGLKRTDETKRKIREKALGRLKGKHWKIENGKRVWYE